MSKNRKHALKMAQKNIDINFNTKEFAQWLIEEVLNPPQDVAMKILQIMSADPKAKKLFKNHKEELQARFKDGEDFSPELALKISEYISENPHRARVSTSPLGNFDSINLKEAFLESKKTKVDEEDENSPCEDSSQQDVEKLLAKIDLQEELISKLKFDKNRINEENQRLKNISKELAKSEEENFSLKQQIEELKNENYFLQMENKALELSNSNLRGAFNREFEKNEHLLQRYESSNETIESLCEEIDSLNGQLENSPQNAPKNKKGDVAPRERKVSKNILANSNRFTPKIPKFALLSPQVLKSVRGQEIRLRNWKEARPSWRPKPSKKVRQNEISENLINSLNIDEIFEISSIRLCLIREKKETEMAEIVKLFADDSQLIQSYREKFSVKDYYNEIKRDNFDIFAVFKDSVKHEFVEGVWWKGVDNAVIFDFGEEKDGDDRSKIAGQLRIIRKILEKYRNLQNQMA